MKTVDPLLKNEYSKRVYTRLGLRKPFATQQQTRHYRMPVLQVRAKPLPLPVPA